MCIKKKDVQHSIVFPKFTTPLTSALAHSSFFFFQIKCTCSLFIIIIIIIIIIIKNNNLIILKKLQFVLRVKILLSRREVSRLIPFQVRF
jgi:type II secretory pathway component PulF